MKEQGLRPDDPEYLRITGVLQAVSRQNEMVKYKQQSQIRQIHQYQQQQLVDQRQQRELQRQQDQQQQQQQQQNGNVPQPAANGINGMHAHTLKYRKALTKHLQDKVPMLLLRVHQRVKPPLLLHLVRPATSIPLPP